MQIVLLTTTTKVFPQKIYLFADKDTIPKAFPNAFVFKDVAWLDTPYQSELAELSIEDYQYSVFPFRTIPQPEGDLRQIQRNDLAALGKHLYIHRNLTAALSACAEEMRVIVGGKVYASPCEFCDDFFKHVAGKCTITDKNKSNICHMRLVFSSDLFEEEKKDARKDPIYTTTLEEEV